MKKRKRSGIMPDTKINAVAESELYKFLSSIGEVSRVEAGIVKCKFCGNTITFNNLHAIIPEEDKVGYCCDSDICIAEMTWGEK